MKILFTGASSFTGYWFVTRLANCGHDVISTFTRSDGAAYGDDVRGQRVRAVINCSRPLFACRFGDEQFLDVIKRENVDLLCHHGSDVTNYKSPEFDIHKAVSGNTHRAADVAKALAENGPAAVIWTGSVFEAGEGVGSDGLPSFSPYGLSKSLSAKVLEYYCREAGVHFGKFVIPHPFGAWEDSRFTMYLMRTWSLGDVASVRTPAYVRDNIQASLVAVAYAAFAEGLRRGPGLSRTNPSGYVGTQGGFTELLAKEMRTRTGWECRLELANQTEFSEPRVRINTEPVDGSALGWDESAAWDENGAVVLGTTTGRAMTKRMECLPNGAALNMLIVVLCYRVVELTVDCLRSLADQIGDVPGTRVVICENGTGPEAVEQLRTAIVANGWENWVNLKAINPNVGFTGGNNAVLRDAMSWTIPPKYFLLLNADTIVQPGALKTLFEAIERSPSTGILGPMMTGTDGSRQVSCFRDHSPVSEFIRGAETGIVNRLLLRDSFQLTPPLDRIQFDWISFACAVIRSDVVRKIGFLDEGFFLYYDDNDYCRTARKAGWLIGCCPDASVLHLEGQSNELPEKARVRDRKPKYYYVSRARYFAKHFGTLGLWTANIAWSAGWLIGEVKRLIRHGRPSACEAEWRDIWTNAWAPVRKSNASLRPTESHIVL